MRPNQQARMLSAKMFTLKVPVCQINTSLVVQISASKAEIFKLVLVLIVTVTDFFVLQFIFCVRVMHVFLINKQTIK